MWWLGAVLALMRLGLITKAWRPGRYLHWRYETAFGRGGPGRGAVLHTALMFGRWVAMMRRFR